MAESIELIGIMRKPAQMPGLFGRHGRGGSGGSGDGSG